MLPQGQNVSTGCLTKILTLLKPYWQALRAAGCNNLLLHHLDTEADIDSEALLVHLSGNGIRYFAGTDCSGWVWGIGLGGRLGRWIARELQGCVQAHTDRAERPSSRGYSRRSSR